MPAIYLIRHADAVEAEPDSARTLSKKGRRQISRVAHVLRSSGTFAPVELWHSPLVRARETAEILAEEARLDVLLVERAELSSESDPILVARRLGSMRKSVALVGHEPHLGALASLLVAGSPIPTVFLMKKASVLALEDFGAGHWGVRWHISPEIIDGA